MSLFLDSNIPMYVVGSEHPNREPARHLLDQVQKGKVLACTSTEVLQEILYRYTSLGRRDLASDVYDLFSNLCPAVLSVRLADTDKARELVCRHSSISSRDAVHAAVMLNNKIRKIATFDVGFDDIPGISRISLE